MEPANRTDDFNLRILKPFLLYIREKFGEAALEKVKVAAGLQPEDLKRKNTWVSSEQVDKILTTGRGMMRDDDEFSEACTYKLKEGYGPLIFLIRAVSIKQIFEFAVKTMRMVSKVSQYKMVDSGRSWLRYQYQSDKPESRLMCLSRKAQIRAVVSIFGNQTANIEETTCVARGDSVCEYEVSWEEQITKLPVLLGGAIGVVAAFLINIISTTGIVPFILLPVLGAACGWIRELRRVNKLSVVRIEEVNQELQALAEEAEEARQEVVAFGQRQQEWASIMEQQVEERTATLEGVVDQVKKMREERVINIQGLAHDLRNPLTVLRNYHSVLSEDKRLQEEYQGVLADIAAAIEMLDNLLKNMMESAIAETSLGSSAPKILEVAPLAEQLRRRLKALVFGRDIRVTVFPTREAPGAIETDELVFDRVIDNVLTNAAKYTKTGSIVVEITGTPGVLCLKVSDTGSGINDEEIEKIFHPHGSVVTSRASNSYGVGLSGVVRLLYQLGGRLEVMSRPGVGTTFWIYFPVAIPKKKAAMPGDDRSPDAVLQQVVKIRRYTP